jgi:hypothetical protein
MIDLTEINKVLAITFTSYSSHMQQIVIQENVTGFQGFLARKHVLMDDRDFGEQTCDQVFSLIFDPFLDKDLYCIRSFP